MDDNDLEIRKLKSDINVLDQRLKEAKKLKSPALYIQQLKDTKKIFENKLKEAQAKSTHWYYR